MFCLPDQSPSLAVGIQFSNQNNLVTQTINEAENVENTVKNLETTKLYGKKEVPKELHIFRL